MKKDFNTWNAKKIIINNTHTVPFFHEREIWFCFLGANVGFEQDGQGEDFQRPVVIIKKFNNEVYWAIPLSTTKKRGVYYFAFPFNTEITSVAILSQIKGIYPRASPGPKLCSLRSRLGRGKPRGILIPYIALLGSEMRKITFSFHSPYVGNKIT